MNINTNLFKLALPLALAAPILTLPLISNAADNADSINKPVTIASNQTSLELNLAANPSTGYSWYLKKADNHFFKFSHYEFTPGNTQMPGAPGKAVFTFDIDPSFHAAPYLSEITFAYMRPWDLSTEMDRTLSIISIPGDPSPMVNTTTSMTPNTTPNTNQNITPTPNPAENTQTTWLSIPSEDK